MPSIPLPGEKVERVERTVAFQGYFRVARYLFRHSLYRGGQSVEVDREVFERGQAAAAAQLAPDSSHVMLCGNPAMIAEVGDLLKARGMRRHRRRTPGHITVENYW